jgi:hypothetical protein
MFMSFLCERFVLPFLSVSEMHIIYSIKYAGTIKATATSTYIIHGT